MLNSAEHKISNAHKYKNIRNSAFLGSRRPRILFFLLINVEMPTVVGILTFMSGKCFCSTELSMKNVLQPRGLIYCCDKLIYLKMKDCTFRGRNSAFPMVGKP